ncbi:hypothetical protein [Flaviaesturariibacter aridisoli]|uniref:RNA polymerase sigma-70 region 4 domain-containing protein n=1 Tax=Flaviaesturariibacter aridisoli TaxID=2545761 RepID=A0A4R4E8H8_9BACT|nr:hypothetical protein [Flaviaesturariibacter aridisoli]TCZ74065.1 hypothetical protein E0486_03035 [Flaviaesturariibacter aridisoli]
MELLESIADLNVEELQVAENLSVRACNVLKQNGMFFLSQVLQYYKTKGTFINFRNCGGKSQYELEQLCEKYKNYLEDGTIRNVIALENGSTGYRVLKVKDAYSIFPLRDKTLDFLSKNRLAFVGQVLDYYQDNGTFRRLRNWTKGIESELSLFVDKIRKFSTEDERKEIEISATEDLGILTPIQLGVLEQWFSICFSSLPVRAQNVVYKIVGEANLTLQTFFESFVKTNINIGNIRNAGEKTISELNKAISNLKKQFSEVQKNISAQDESYQLFINAFGKSKGIAIQQLLEYEVAFIQQRFPLFAVFTNHFLSFLPIKAEYHMMLACFLKRDFENAHLNDIAMELGYSPERIRQLRPTLVAEALKFFVFEKSVSDVIIANSSYVQSISDCINLSNIRKNYFEAEIADLQDAFIFRALGSVFRHSHTLFIYENDQSTFAFLIANDVFSAFEFDSFAEDIEVKISERRSEDEFLNFEGYIYQFVPAFDALLFERIKRVAENVLEIGYGISVTYDGQIVFPKNSNRSLPDLIHDVLEKLGKPSHLTEIIQSLQETYPERLYSEGSVRSNIFRVPDIICFGKSSTYGLKVWEDEKGIRGGTIRDIVEEYLLQNEEPKHILLIEEYVQKYRDTNEKNILTNIKLDSDDRFLILPGAIVGLKSKQYNIKNHRFKKLPRNAPDMLKKYIGRKKVTEEEMEKIAMKLFKVDVYQSRYWLRQHKEKNTFTEFLK